LVAHAGQTRKGGEDVPYAVHPVHMALILTRFGARNALIQGALLHDVVEDCDGWDAERLESEFGSEVAAIVADLTEDKSKTWVERKQWAVDHIPHMSDDSVTVKAADKLHNLESLGQALAQSESVTEVWTHFKGGRDDTLSMDRLLVAALTARVGGSLGLELAKAFAEVERLA
jgi:(p)ppGpp synthase/HD superfamily hydrolase